MALEIDFFAGARKLLVAAALALPLAGCLDYDSETQRGYVVDDKLLAQVKPGEAAEKVLGIMGTPSTTSTVGGDAWYYVSQKLEQKLEFLRPQVVDQRVLAIYFTKAKKVERVANYGIEDGKVFDFITRTTPTAGAEQSFVRNLLKNLLRF
jgi:outer membrane protein assembly factor BamE (lipoprotein component of BamABCDE complex)